MTPYYADDWLTIYQGDARDVRIGDTKGSRDSQHRRRISVWRGQTA